MRQSASSATELEISDYEYFRMLGYPKGHLPEGRAREIADATRAWYAENGLPWTYRRELAVGWDDETLLLDGVSFPSPQLATYFREHAVTRAFGVVANPGSALPARAHEHWQGGRPDEYFFAEVYGTAVAERLFAEVTQPICKIACAEGAVPLEHYLPGYGGWDIAEQPALHQLIFKHPEAAPPEPIEVLASGMPRPKKVMLAIAPIAPEAPVFRHDPSLVPCGGCSLEACPVRLAPYQHAPSPASPAFRATSFPPLREAAPTSTMEIPLTQDAAYTVNRRALRKWTEERVRLDPREDGGWNALFRFDGSTCSNLGHPLAFDYRVEIGPLAEGLVIRQTECIPAEGEEGHQQMCAYLKNADAIMTRIAEPPPLVGTSLDSVLTWKRTVKQSGCYCDAGSRAHKWGLALESIHYALVQKLIHQGAFA
jgi:hypothetical protein